MKINGGIRYCEKGLTASLRAMHVQSELIGMYNENVTGFDKIHKVDADACEKIATSLGAKFRNREFITNGY